MSVPKDIEAEIYFLTEDESGISTSAFTGYRPQFYYNEQDWGASYIYVDAEAANSGETVRACLGFLSPEENFGKVYVGMDFLIR